MGMAASQARYLSLQARMSNVEYQGQQINQERTILSQQATALYNSLLDMQVPTPPSTSDYTKITYSGVDGATNFTLGNVKPYTSPSGESNRYIVEINTSYTGSVLEQENTVRTVTDLGDTRNGRLLHDEDLTTSYPMENLANIYVKIKEGEEGEKPTCKSLLEAGTNYYTVDATTNTFKLKTGNQYIIMDGKSPDTEWKIDPTSKEIGKAVSGNRLFSFEDAKILFTSSIYDWDGYKEAIDNSGMIRSDGEKVTTEDFDVYIDLSSGSPVVRFVLASELISEISGEATYVQPYEYIANGKVTKTEAKEDCTLAFDSQGRITQIGIPQKDTNGEIIGWTIVPLSASTSTDTIAYDDAYNQYEYNQYLYDKKVQEINAKTEIIQAEDRSLELRLQRLDNERTQLKTEMEAVKKVINENIDNSYKTFSG